MTHEETVTFHAKEIQSYRQLPQLLYHFSIKERDELRPRGGLLRVREFIMKDAYSFDRDEAGLDESFRKQRRAYHRIFQRCGLEYSASRPSPGSWAARSRSTSSRRPGSGENTLVTCENGDYAADLEVARGIPRAREFPGALAAPKEVATPGVTTIEALAELLGIDAAATSKAMPVVTTDGTLVLGLVRGDDRLSEPKMLGVLESDYRPATDDEIRAAFGAGGGSLGPVGVEVEVVADEALREGQFVAGANRDGWHLLGVEAGRDYEPRFADLREARRGRHVPRVRRSAPLPDGDRGRPHLQVRRRATRSRSARRSSTRTGRRSRSSAEATASGPARVMAAAVEQHHDENGIVWPASIAPYDVHVLALHGGAEEVLALAEDVVAAPRRGRPPGALRRPRRAAGREVRGRGSHRLPCSRHRREEVARGRLGRRSPTRRLGGRPRSGVRRAEMGHAVLMARRRRYSDDPFGPTIERLMEETGTTYRGLAAKADLSAGLPQPHRPRQPAGAVERRHRADRRVARTSRRSTSASTASASSRTSSRRCPSSSTASTSASRNVFTSDEVGRDG